jgi:hypothetical protein
MQDRPKLNTIQLALLSETEDHQKAARSFLEKRKPIFVGK